MDVVQVHVRDTVASLIHSAAANWSELSQNAISGCGYIIYHICCTNTNIQQRDDGIVDNLVMCIYICWYI